jgi:hypothetical protein
VHEATRRLHDTIRTEDAYVLWTKLLILYHGKRHPLELGEAEVVEFLTHLAVRRNVAASTPAEKPFAPPFVRTLPQTVGSLMARAWGRG